MAKTKTGSIVTNERRRRLTYAEFVAEATERFGDDQAQWAFHCPNCGDVATAQDFVLAAGDPGCTGQECIGRTLRRDNPRAGRGCDWVAYGLIPGPWEVVFPAQGDQPERSVRSFPFADEASLGASEES